MMASQSGSYNSLSALPYHSKTLKANVSKRVQKLIVYIMMGTSPAVVRAECSSNSIAIMLMKLAMEKTLTEMEVSFRILILR